MRRQRWTWVAVAVPMVLVAGCRADALTRRELVVYFDSTATHDQQQAVLTSCDGAAPNTTPEPLVTSSYASGRVGNVRFRIDHANDHDIAQLERCIQKLPGVLGVDVPDITG